MQYSTFDIYTVTQMDYSVFIMEKYQISDSTVVMLGAQLCAWLGAQLGALLGAMLGALLGAQLGALLGAMLGALLSELGALLGCFLQLYFIEYLPK